MKYLGVLVFTLFLFGCNQTKNEYEKLNTQFSSELSELKEYFHIPGLAVSVIKDGEEIYSDFKGYANIVDQTNLNSNHLFPIASLTKVYTGVAIMKLVEEGKLELETPLNKYYPELLTLNDSLLIKHVLSHTSQGKIGEKFYYSSRFSMLTKVVEQASGISFNAYLEKTIFSPLQLEHTYLLKDSFQISQNNLQIASPYVYEGDSKKGFIDFGYSASAGIISNLEDIQRFDLALDNNEIISQASKEQMFSSFKEDLPYGYGIFSQDFYGEKIVWAYGQYDCYSSLFLKVPEKNLTLILLANNNLMSDPARLIYGDISSSLFALSFLNNYLKDVVEENPKDFLRKEKFAKALAESFLARYDSEKIKSSADILKKLAIKDSVLDNDPKLNLLHNLSFLKDVSYYKDLGEFNDFDMVIESIGPQLHQKDSLDPYVNMYLGSYYYRSGKKRLAKYHLENIVEANNFSRNWYINEAESLLKTLE